MQAGHRNLDNLIAIIDRNKLQIDGCTEDVMALSDVTTKINSFFKKSSSEGQKKQQLKKLEQELKEYHPLPHNGR